ncbi:glycosyltransferase [Myxococcaceae bacterium JPH2]|nr:glycosyltransferase [Myxococcaceae bacterium JPH2]
MAAGARPRVLLIAELCNPDWVSVPLEGWSLFHALTDVADVHLVTQVRNRENILKQGLVEGRDFTALDSTPVERPLDKVGGLLRGQAGVGWTTATALSVLPYYFFEELLWRRFGARIQAREFDVVHRYTPISPTTPSTLAARCQKAGVPFIMGPLNGGLPWPKGFGGARRREKEWLSYVRDAYKLMPFYRSTRENAAAIITGSRATRGQVAPEFQSKTVYVPENAIDVRRFGTAKAEAPAGLPLRVAFVGRFVPYKGMAMLIDAAAPLVREGKVQVEFIGDGAEMPNLRAQVAREGLESGVTFAGWVKHQELQGRLAKNHIFGFPSVREFGGAVVAEAMALGLVPIVMDYGGPGEIVSPDTGFAIPMGTPEEIVLRVREVLTKLAADPSVIGPMGERARARILKHFTWKAKAEQVREVYRWVMGERGQPDFGMPLAD